MKFDSINKETQIELREILYRSSCRSWWMLGVVLLLAFSYVSPLLREVDIWISVMLIFGVLTFSAFVVFWLNIPIDKVSKALPPLVLTSSEKNEMDRSGDRLIDHLVPLVLVIFLVALLLFRTRLAQ